MHITIRPAVARDAARIAEIDLLPDVRPWLDLPPESHGGLAAWTRANVRWINHPSHRCVVAVSPEGAVVGSVTLSRARGAKEGACLGLKVDPAYQGRGVGTALLRWLIEAADAVPLDRVYLAVHRDNARAIDLYTRHGFVYAGPSTGDCDRMVRARPVFWGS